MFSMLDYVNMMLESESELTKSEFKRIRNYGSSSELEEAVRKMEEAGGYENLPD